MIIIFWMLEYCKDYFAVLQAPSQIAVSTLLQYKQQLGLLRLSDVDTSTQRMQSFSNSSLRSGLYDVNTFTQRQPILPETVSVFRGPLQSC